MTLRILYLVHDLTDATVAKRIAMLRDGGAVVTVAGFRRGETTITTVAGAPAIDFGQTYNGGFARRILAVLQEVLTLKKRRSLFRDADLIIARNLEMLAIGVRGRSLDTPHTSLIYESLDIHRLLLGHGSVGRSLRRLEGWLAKRAVALLTSSPAFVENYFDRISDVRLPVRLIENKVYDPAFAAAPPVYRAPALPWRIGWFGIIRCRKSFGILTDLANNSAGAVEVFIRGRPALDQIPDFHQVVAATRGLHFDGPYKNPDDLQTLYAGVHFNWSIDMFEEGLNSSWLLPNRLYEGGLYNSVPLAREDVETGRFLKRIGIGVVLKDPLPEALAAFFQTVTTEAYLKLEKAAMETPSSQWLFDADEHAALMIYLESLRTVGERQ